jgi:hypothetical protein
MALVSTFPGAIFISPIERVIPRNARPNLVHSNAASISVAA